MASDGGKRRISWPEYWGPAPHLWGWSPGDEEAENLPGRVSALEELEGRLNQLETYAKWGTRGVWVLVGLTVGLAMANGQLSLSTVLQVFGG